MTVIKHRSSGHRASSLVTIPVELPRHPKQDDKIQYIYASLGICVVSAYRAECLPFAVCSPDSLDSSREPVEPC